MTPIPTTKIRRIYLENWKGKRTFVVRTSTMKGKTILKKGRFVTWRRQKGSGFKKIEDIKNVYQKNKTLYINREDTGNVIISQLEPTIISKPLYDINSDKLIYPKAKRTRLRKGVVQYVIQGNYKGRTITTSSGHWGSNQEKIDSARQKFILKLSNPDGQKYDEDEGINKLAEVTNYKEFWQQNVGKKKNEENINNY